MLRHLLAMMTLWALVPAPSAAATKSTSPQFVSVTVGPGDTLGRLAKRHGTDVQTLQKDNAITNPDRIRVGQQLKVR